MVSSRLRGTKTGTPIGKSSGCDTCPRLRAFPEPERDGLGIKPRKVSERCPDTAHEPLTRNRSMTEQSPKQQFHVRKFADFGTSEEFVLPVLDLIEILKGTTIFDPQRDEVSGTIVAIGSEGLPAAFLELRKIRLSVGQDLPMLDQFQMYEDFYGKLWRAYKEYMQRAVKAMGFDIGFLFQKDAQFEKGLEAFRENNPTAPSALEQYLREVRRLWHTELADFRNTIVQHPGADRAQFQKFYNPQFAEELFREVWHTIVDILGMLLEFRLHPGVYLEWQSWNDPGPRWPKRFRWQLGTRLQIPSKKPLRT